MTSEGWIFGRGLGSKMEEKVASDETGGKDVVTDIGLWREKNEAT